MESTDKHVTSPNYSETTGEHLSKWKRFINWSTDQEGNRLLWTALSILGHGCVVTIITLMTIIFTGNHFIFWVFAIAAMAMSVISYLAALPTRITIPIFFLSLLIDVLIIITCIFNGFTSNSVFY